MRQVVQKKIDPIIGRSDEIDEIDSYFIEKK